MSNVSRNAIRSALHQIIGDKYEVLQWIGGGGMAEVFLAKHRTHGALFAVKVLAEQLAEEAQVVARFMDEARTAASLGGHPNIAPVFDVGEAGTLHYLIMPYIEGEDVKSYLERHGRLSQEEAVAIVRQVAEALVWAAERRVVHRDLKPANVRIDRSGRAIVLDFGIAKAGDAPSARTKANETLGTPYYMSPEQIRAEPCDHRSDLYSLGVIFFELLTGMKPFTGDSFRAIEIGHLQKLPAALSTIVPGVSPELERIVNRLLEKDRELRYQTARELLEDLRRGFPLDFDVRLEPVSDRRDMMADHAPGLERDRGIDRGEEQLEEAEPVAAAPAPVRAEKRRSGGLKWLVTGVVAVGVAVGIYFGTRGGGETVKQGAAKDRGEAKDYPAVLNTPAGTMFLVTGGKFIFGEDEAESPNKRQDVEMAPYYVDATEVSNEQYARFVDAKGHPAPATESFRTSPSLPVTSVTLEDARGYCVWAGKRLPSEQEWEKAARGVDGRLYPWGNQPLPNPGKLVAVDDYPERQSPFRALGMAGNAFEWTTTPFPVTEREIEDMQKALGGGATVTREWFAIKSGSFLIKDDRFFRLYMRRGWPANQANPAIGFRCVKDAN